MTSTTAGSRATSDVDLFSVEHVADPFPTLDALRESSAAVYMTAHDYWLLTRYDDVRAATADWETYTSAQGVALRDEQNAHLVDSVLASDPPQHDQLRAVLSDRLAPRALRALRDDVAAQADALVSELVERSSFDAVTDLARVFPINVVANLIGLPEHGRERLHPGADAVFTGFGPDTPMLRERGEAAGAYHQWMFEVSSREQLTPGSWGAELMDAVEQGRIDQVGAFKSMSAYLTAGMDTSVNAIAAMMRLFAERPDVWEELRAEPALAGPLFEEILRTESPVQGFFRMTTREVTIGDEVIPAGQRVMLHWGAANRDSRHYPNPDVFDLRRNPLDHLAFGYGIHACAGQGLARMEAMAVVQALLSRVERIELTGPAERRYNPVVRSLESVPVSVQPLQR